MRSSLMMSCTLHAAIVLVSFYSLRIPLGLEVPEPQPIHVDLATAADLTKLKAGTKRAKQETPASAPKRSPKAKTPKRKVSKKAKAKPVRKKTAVVSSKREAEKILGLDRAKKSKPRPKPPKKAKTTKAEAAKFDADKIAALLNKVPEKSVGGPSAPMPVAHPERPSRGQDDGSDSAMTISEIDALRARIAQCWSPPVAGLGAASTAVKLRLRLNPDGTLMGQPELVSASASPIFRAAADSAVRAVWQCQPYALPATKYALWRDMILNFDPREMIGG